MHIEPLGQTFILIASAFLAVALLVRLRLSPIVGYLAAGLLLGPSGLGIIDQSAGTAFFGELGVAFLMFVVGLEFSLPRIIAAGRVVFGAGTAQVVATAVVGTLVAHSFGSGWGASVVLGGALAMSSTAIVHKQLIDQEEATTGHGVAASGVLLFQDLAALPLLAFIGAIDDHHAKLDLTHIAVRLVISAVVFIVIAALARRTLGRLIEWTARSRVNEPFLLAAVSLIVGGALTAQALGLSLPIGAFVVGMLVGESDFRHQVEEEIRPFRDLLLGLFFITIGMSVEWDSLLAHPWTVAGFLILILPGKLVIAAAVSRLTGVAPRASMRAGLLLAHTGEFGLLIVSEAMAGGFITGRIGHPALVAISLSMLAAPVLIQWNERLTRFIGPAFGRSDAPQVEELQNHIVLAGCGPVGSLLATALEASGVHYVALERNPERVRRALAQGHQVIFGDATRPGLLAKAGTRKASALIVLVDNWRTAQRITRHARILNPTLTTVCSLRDDTGRADLEASGVTHILSESVPAALALAARALALQGLDESNVHQRIEALRSELESAWSAPA